MNYIFRLSLLLIIFFNLIGCSPFCYQSPRYVKLAHEITNNMGVELKKEKDLYLVGTGGQMMDDIQMMAMSFFYYQEVNLENGRKCIVNIIDEYLEAINSNNEIRPFLHEYPFTPKNVEIRIFIYKPDRSDLPPEKIYVISSINGIIKYYIGLYPCKAVIEETYEEAKANLRT